MEIERKFLVNRTIWEEMTKPEPQKIIQGYLSDAEDCTVRIRVKNNKGFITVKGKTLGISRSEYEYEIPESDAAEMVAEFCAKKIIKHRYEIVHGKHLWEVDVFEGKLAPLIIAEIELKTEEESFDLPSWVTEEVSDDPQYYNSKLIQKV